MTSRSRVPVSDNSGAARHWIVDAAKDAGQVTALALALMIPFFGLRTLPRAGGLELQAFPLDVAVAVVLLFVGRLALSAGACGTVPGALAALAGGVVVALAAVLPPIDSELIRVVGIGCGTVVALRAALALARHLDPTGVDHAGEVLRAAAKKGGAWVAPGMVLLALVAPMLPVIDRWLLEILVLVGIYVILGWGLNIVVGLAGLLDLGYVAFYAVGAYGLALLARDFDLSFWMALPLAGIIAAGFGIVLGFPVLRLRGDYLAIVTLGFGEIVRIVLINWTSFTNGPDGIPNLPRPTFFGLPFSRSPPAGTESFHQFFELPYSSFQRIVFLYYVILVLALIANGFILRLRRLPIGRAWEALREDEIACRSLGINPTNVKLSAFALGAMFGGFAGALFAARQGFVSPESFSFIESAIIVSIVVLGGMGSQTGVVIAAALFIGVPEAFRELHEYRMLAFGAAMVLIMVWRPGGLLARREPTIRLHVARPEPGQGL